MADSQSTSAKTVFKVFLFTDLVGSTDLKKRLGDTVAAKAIGKHDALFRKSLKRFGGTEEDNAGDVFFASFDLPSEAVRCGLEFLSGLRSLRLPEPLHVRVGVHAGEIVRLTDADAASSRGKLIGLAVDTGARVMGLAEGGQVLLTRSAFDSARQQFLSLSDGSSIQWLAHGPYLFKGVDDPLEVFEAGIQGFSPLRAPPDSEQARRAVTPGEEDTLGWRPAGGMAIPGRPGWRLEEKLGQGSFGEVWLARQERTKDLRSFKFCFHADRLRALKRELTLFRVMKEELGDRPDIARLYDVRVNAPPYFLEMDYTPAGDLARWAKSHGGIGAVPLEKRLKITAQVAQALSAAHSVGVIHKDIKPTNVLIEEKKDGSLQARLTDFGIGQLMNRKAVEEAGITVEGFTTKGSTGLSTPGSPTSGTRLYMAPELFAGKPPSARSDAYALGVMLYQMVVGDLKRHLGQGWERDVQDQLLREAIAALVDGDPARRLENVGDLTEHLERIEARRARFEAKR
ncbi:protein kinase, partial [Candidatus Sumerlaeota bacterium]|nr:protein kinase [Candidatus Sumerlaeota bacterium]